MTVLIDYEILTLEQVLAYLPPWMRADFDCPDHGPHDFLQIVDTLVGKTIYQWCKHCDRRRRIPCPDTERDALDVIYALQFSR